MMTGIFRIVTFDGGGIRGAFTAKLLEMLNHEVEFLSKVHLLSGTSTGSLIALGLAYGLSPSHLVQLYQHLGKGAFQLLAHGDTSQPLYDLKALKGLLESMVFKNKPTLASLNKMVIIPSFKLYDVNVNRWRPYMFHNLSLQEGEKHQVVDVALASSAAPIFFAPYQGYIDGGIYANNPSLTALCQVLKHKKIPLEQIRLLSLGTGDLPDSLQELEPSWGSNQWMQGDKSTSLRHPLLSLITDGVFEAAHEGCEALMQDHYKRVSSPFKEHIAMDDWAAISLCMKYAENFPHDYKEKWSQLKAWIRDSFLDE